MSHEEVETCILPVFNIVLLTGKIVLCFLTVTEFLTLSLFKFDFQGPGFVSFVHFGDKTVSSNVPCSTKKQAEQLAAREALLAIGIHDPENAFRNKGSRKSKSKRTFAARTGFKRTWVHSHGGQGPQLNAWLVVNITFCHPFFLTVKKLCRCPYLKKYLH